MYLTYTHLNFFFIAVQVNSYIMADMADMKGAVKARAYAYDGFPLIGAPLIG